MAIFGCKIVSNYGIIKIRFWTNSYKICIIQFSNLPQDPKFFVLQKNYPYVKQIFQWFFKHTTSKLTITSTSELDIVYYTVYSYSNIAHCFSKDKWKGHYRYGNRDVVDGKFLNQALEKSYIIRQHCNKKYATNTNNIPTIQSVFARTGEVKENKQWISTWVCPAFIHFLPVSWDLGHTYLTSCGGDNHNHPMALSQVRKRTMNHVHTL